MKHRALLFTLFGLFMLAFSACKDNDDDFVLNYDYEYFPQDSGHYVIYQVDSIIISTFFPAGSPERADTQQYVCRELIESTWEDAEGRPGVRIEWACNPDTSQDLESTVPRIWHAIRTASTAEKIEDNLRYIRLLFPPKQGLTWQGNAFINITSDIKYLQDWEYEIIEVDVPKTINGLQFDSTLTVLQVDNENLVEKVYALETYAKGVGLVYKESLSLTKSPGISYSDILNLGDGKITTMSVIDYKQ